MECEGLLAVAEKIIYSYSGLNVANAQKNKLEEFLNSRISALALSEKDYLSFLQKDDVEMQLVINQVTVNETYFFRERLQFEYFRNHLFPKFAGKKMNIWSAACSTGEEPLSLLALAASCGVDASVFATDIDDQALAFFKQGVYGRYSFREDGKQFHDLLKRWGHWEGDSFVVDRDFIDRITIGKFNLVQDTFYPSAEKFDLVLLRNVCIYFNKEKRHRIVEVISGCMDEDAKLFFSINEVGSFGNELKEINLYKNHNDALYFFEKNSAAVKKEAEVKKEKPVLSVSAEKKERRSRKPEARPVAEERKTVQHQEQVPADSLSPDFEKICSLVNYRKFDEALEIADRYDSSHDTKAISKFLKGYIKYYADEKELSEKFFESAELLKPDLWPAYFYNGLLLKDVGKSSRSAESFTICERLLEDDGCVRKYSFILDSFDPAYFRNICRSFKGDV